MTPWEWTAFLSCLGAAALFASAFLRGGPLVEEAPDDLDIDECGPTFDDLDARWTVAVGAMYRDRDGYYARN